MVYCYHTFMMAMVQILPARRKIITVTSTATTIDGIYVHTANTVQPRDQSAKTSEIVVGNKDCEATSYARLHYNRKCHRPYYSNYLQLIYVLSSIPIYNFTLDARGCIFHTLFYILPCLMNRFIYQMSNLPVVVRLHESDNTSTI